MDDELLNRARLLTAGAKDIISAQEIKISSNVTINMPQSPTTQSSPVTRDTCVPPSFKGAAIQGSSLLTTFSDMRSWCPRGSSLLVDGIPCFVSETGEYSSTRLYLTKDFSGPTNLEAALVPTLSEKTIKTLKVKKTMRPVDTTDIKDAVKGLDNFTSLQLQQRLNSTSPSTEKVSDTALKRPTKLKRPFPRNQHNKNFVTYVEQLQQPSLAYQDTISPASPTPVSNENILRCQSAPQTNSDSKNPAKQVRLPPLQSLTINSALGGGGAAGRLIQPAAYLYEEIFERKNPVNVEQERLKIAERLAKKRKQDRLEKIKKEEEDRKFADAVKAKSEAKASQFLEKTMQRVEERKQKLVEKSLLAQEEARKDELKKAEKMAALASDMHAARVAAIRVETAKRLASLKKQARLEEKEKEFAMAKKLAELEKVRGRAVPTSVIVRGGNGSIESHPEEVAHLSLNLQLRKEEDDDDDQAENNAILGGEDDIADILEDVTDDYVNMREKYGMVPSQPASKIPSFTATDMKGRGRSTQFQQASASASAVHHGANKNSNYDDDELSDDSVEVTSQLLSLRRLKAMEKIEMATVSINTRGTLGASSSGPLSPTVSELTVGSPTFSRKSVSTIQTGKSGGTKQTKKSFAPWKLAPLPTLPFVPIPVKQER